MLKGTRLSSPGTRLTRRGIVGILADHYGTRAVWYAAMTPLLEPRTRPTLLARVNQVVAEIHHDRPDLASDADLATLQAHVTQPTGNGPALHLDDQSGLGNQGLVYDWSYLQDRARLRAYAGDVVATAHPPPDGYEAYCRQHLGLGEVDWVTPRQKRYRTNLATHCWTDRAVRHELVHRLRTDRLRFVHPLMGSRDPWQLAQLLQQRARRPLHVLSPHPSLTQWVNDKIEFAGLVRRLFGERWLPTTHSCASLSILTQRLRELAEHHQVLGVKLPDAAGGGGNIVIPAQDVRGRSLRHVRTHLRQQLKAVGWRGERSLLVGAWETDVLSAPSAQLWIPGSSDPPIVQGVFDQIVEGTIGEFVGCRTSELPTDIVDEIVDRAWLLGRLFQRLGYVGCCSFDLVLVGKQLDRSRIEFIECNGRWGGTSLPMTLANRLVPWGAPERYIVRTIDIPPDCAVEFGALLDHLGELLFDRRTGNGRVVLFNPLKIGLQAGVKLIAFGRTVSDAQRFVEGELRDRFEALFRTFRGSP